MILDLLFIAIIIIHIQESGVFDYIKRFISRIITGAPLLFKFKLFDCQLCQMWWIGLIYLLFTGKFNLSGIVVVAIFSYSMETLSQILETAKDIISSTIDLIYTKYIDKYEK